MSAWLGILLVLGLLVGSLQILTIVQTRSKLNPELIRKGLHITMGMATLSFPFLFRQVWPVILLAVISILMLGALRILPDPVPWKNVLCKTDRPSCGEFCFPIAVALLFFLSHKDILLFTIPMLTLTLADAASALVGQRYGRTSYCTADGIKTTEGSFTFFTVAFLSGHVPLLLLSATGRYECLCIGLILGGVVMLFEGISWKGLDNFFIPVSTYLLLKSHLHVSSPELTVRLLVLLCTLLFVVIFRHRTTFDGSAIMGVALFGYFSWVLGGLAWLAMPLILFFSYRALLPKRFRSLTNTHTIYAVISVASTGIIWLFWKSLTGSNQPLYAYTLAFAIHATIIAIARMSGAAPTKERFMIIGLSILRSWLLLFVPYLLFEGAGRADLVDFFAAPVLIALPTFGFYFSKPDPLEITRPGASMWRWVRQAGFAAAGSSLGLMPWLTALR
jgi:phytol kinase